MTTQIISLTVKSGNIEFGQLQILLLKLQQPSTQIVDWMQNGILEEFASLLAQEEIIDLAHHALQCLALIQLQQVGKFISDLQARMLNFMMISMEMTKLFTKEQQLILILELSLPSMLIMVSCMKTVERKWLAQKNTLCYLMKILL